jgi:uncharacterized protein with PIN domain
MTKNDRDRCPTCGHPIGPWKPLRVCALCKQPIRKGHKWHIVNSVVRHRVCTDPDAYEKKAK